MKNRAPLDMFQLELGQLLHQANAVASTTPLRPFNRALSALARSWARRLSGVVVLLPKKNTASEIRMRVNQLSKTRK